MSEFNKILPNLGSHNTGDLLYATGLDKEGNVQFTSNRLLKVIFNILNTLHIRTDKDVSKNILNLKFQGVIRIDTNALKEEIETIGNIGKREASPSDLKILIAGLKTLIEAEKVIATSEKMARLAGHSLLPVVTAHSFKPLIENRKSSILLDIHNALLKNSIDDSDFLVLSAIFEKEKNNTSHNSNRIIEKIKITEGWTSKVEKNEEGLEIDKQKMDHEFLTSLAPVNVASLAQNRSSPQITTPDENISAMLKNDPTFEARLKEITKKLHRFEVKDLLDHYIEKRAVTGELTPPIAKLEGAKREFIALFNPTDERDQILIALETSPLIKLMRDHFTTHIINTDGNQYILKLENSGFTIGPDSSQEFNLEIKKNSFGETTEIVATLKSDFYYAVDSQLDKLQGMVSLIALEKGATLTQTLTLVQDGEEGFRIKEHNGYTIGVKSANHSVRLATPPPSPVISRKIVQRAIGEGPESVASLMKAHIHHLEGRARA